MLHNYRDVYSCWETEYVWDTCMKLIPAFLSDWSTLPEVESIKSMKSWYTTVSSSDCRGAYSYANTHMMAVVVEWNMCGVPVWTWFRHSSVIWPWLKHCGRRSRRKTCESWSPAIWQLFEWFLGAYSFTNTLGMVVVVRQNVCGVRVWSGIRHISIIQGLWRKFRAQYQRNVESVCINVNLSDFRVPFSTQVHILC